MSIVRIELWKNLSGYYVVGDYEFRESLKAIRDFLDKELDWNINGSIFSVYSLKNGKKDKEIYSCQFKEFEVKEESLMECSKEELIKTLSSSFVQLFNYNEVWKMGFVMGFCEFRDSLRILNEIVDDSSKSTILVRTLDSKIIYVYKEKNVSVINSHLMEIDRKELLDTIKKDMVSISYQSSPLSKKEDLFVCKFKDSLLKIRGFVKDTFSDGDIKKAIFHVSTLEDDNKVTKEIFYVTKTKFVTLNKDLMRFSKEQLFKKLGKSVVRIEYIYKNDPKPTILYSELKNSLDKIRKEVNKYFMGDSEDITFYVYELASGNEMYSIRKNDVIVRHKERENT